LKPANLNRLWGLALGAACLTLGACDSGGGENMTATTGVMTDGSGSSESNSSTSGSSDSSTSGSSESTSGSETTGPPPEGLGCGVAPACDKGELDEAIFELVTEADMETIAGHTSLRGSLEVNASDFTCLDFLACLEDVGGDVTIYGNEYLNDLSGTDGIRNIGSVFCPQPGQPSCTAGSLVVSNNSAMTDMNGFNALLQTTISLNITRNDAVEDVSGLTSLVAVQRELTIRDNPELKALSGMHDLQAVGGGFVVTQNPNLCITEVQAVGGDLQQGPDLDASSTDANNFDC
jgi:hypothetical protein